MKNLLFTATSILLPILYGWAQPGSVRPLHIGDTVPGQHLKNNIKYPVSTIHIRVQNPSGKVLEGAALRLLKATTLAVTNAAGKASMVIGQTDTLTITHIGYNSKREYVDPANKQELIITMMPTATILEEVTVNTGYQYVPKERATGSFAQIDNSLFNRSVSTNILDRLESIVPALLVDKRTINNTASLSNMTIRGLSTFFSGTSPLVVVDNFPYDGNLSNINPNDVESLTILKDAAATSIWGAKAGNGVIVINTKKAAYNQPLRITLNANTTIQQKPNLWYLPQMKTDDFINLEQFLFDKGFYNATLTNMFSRPVVSPVVELLARQRSGVISPADASEAINSLRTIDVRNDFYKHFCALALKNQYSLSLSSGNNTMNYLFSAGYDENRNNNNLRGNQDQRLTLRFANSIKFTPKLELQTSLTYALQQIQANSPGGYGAINTGSGKSTLYPYAQLADVHGNPLSIAKDYRAAYTDTTGAGKLLDWKYRPLAELALTDNQTRMQDVLLNINARYTINSWLNAEIKYQYENANNTNRIHYTPDAYLTRNLVNRFTQINGSTVKRVIPLGGILNNSSGSMIANDIRLQLNLNKDWQGKNKITALAGAEMRQAASKANGYRVYGYNDAILTYANMDYTTPYPIYGGLSGNSFIPSSLSFNDYLNRFVSVYANAAYTGNNKYIVSASARKDASNLLGVSTNLKGVPLWSAGLAWVASTEDFYKVKWLPYLKLRCTYGYSGNTDNNRSAYSTISYATFPNYLTNLFYSNIINPPNPSLSWEKITTLNIGIDFHTKERRLSGSIEFYSKNARNLLSPTPVDPSTGFSRLTLNKGEIDGNGIDIELHTLNTRGRLQWTTDLLFSYTNHTVKRYSGNVASASAYVGSGLGFSPLEGKSAYTLFSYQWSGLDAATGDPQGYLNKQVTKDYLGIQRAPIADLVAHGPTLAPYFGALRNTIAWKQLSLSANITYRVGYFFRRNTIHYTNLFNLWAGHTDYAFRWQQVGDELQTNVPSLTYPANYNRDDFYTNSAITVERGDHIRLQDIRLEYGFQNKTFTKHPFQNIQLYMYAANLGILWRANKAGLDPDYASGYGYLPPTTSFSLGIKTTIQPVK